ncbi:MAG: PEP-CTERM sorting domain-containing protein [Pirellula sp.]
MLSSKIKTPIAVAILCASIVWTQSVRADLLYSTNFNAPTYANGGLIGQDSWAITGASVVSPINVANAATNGNVALTTTGQDVNRGFASTTSGSIFLSASIVVSAAQATGDYFLHLGDGGQTNFYNRVFARSSGAGFQMSLGTSSGATPNYGTTILNFNTEYNILARYDFVAGAANDTGALFINPNDPMGIGDTPYVVATTQGTDSALISSVNLRQGGATSSPSLIIDNIAVNSIAAVPEPSSIGLLAIGALAGLFAVRKSRKK